MFLKYSNSEERHHSSCVDTSERHAFIALNLEQLSALEIQTDTAMLGNWEGALMSLLQASLLLGGRTEKTNGPTSCSKADEEERARATLLAQVTRVRQCGAVA